MLVPHISPATRSLVQPHLALALGTQISRAVVQRLHRQVRPFSKDSSSKGRVSDINLRELKVNSQSSIYLARASYTVTNPTKSNQTQGSEAARDTPIKKFLNKFERPSSGIYGPPPPPPIRFSGTSYITDSELYLDGRTLKEELSRYATGIRWNEPDGLIEDSHCPVRQALMEYEKKAHPDVYNGFGYNEPDGKPPITVTSTEEAISEFDNNASIYAQPFKWNEPDGLPQEPLSATEQALKEYDETKSHGYKPFGYMEPDGLPTEKLSSTEAALNEFDQTQSYEKGFAFQEPDGLPPSEVSSTEKALNEFDQQQVYNKGFAAYEPDGQAPLAADPVQEGLRPFDKESGLGVANQCRTSSTSLQAGKETNNEKRARRAKLEADFEKSSVRFVEDVQAVRRGDRARLSKKLIDEFELETSMILNQIGHLRSKHDARLEELNLVDRNITISKQRPERSTCRPFSASSAQEEADAFKSNIDFRREEDVFTGQNQSGWQQEEKKKNRGTAKRVLLSATACTGIFYAGDVVSQFFATGGSEGTGAVGL